MIQMMKKPVSIFLAVLMVFSCFSGMSLTALAADEVSENISLVASVSSNLSTISGTHYSVSCGYMVADDKGMRVNSFGALTINARKGETISKVILSYSEGGYRNTLSASIGTFDGNSTITGINAQQVSISSTSTAGVIISAVTVYFEGSLSNPTVTLTGGANAKSSGGLLTQSYLPGAMDTVTYTALTGAAFPEFETYTLNGVTVERTSDTVVTISGTPTANTEFTVPDAESSSKIVTWNSATISSISSSITKDYTYTANGITLNKTGKGKFANNNIMGYDSTASFEFTTATGKFTSIEIETSEIYDGGNWTKDGNTLKWNGTPSNSVSLSGSGLYLEGVSSITFVIKPNTYTVTWQNEDGSVLETDTVVAEGTVPTYDGATPTKADDAQYTYTFAGWTPEVVAATQDVTYTAQFTPVAKFSVFVKKLTGGTITVSNVTGLTTVAQLKDLLVTETGVPASAMRLIFAGKQLEDDKTLGEYNIQKESTIHLVIRTYTITWKSDENTVIDTTNVAYGETPTHEDPAAYEDADYTYTFAGWTPEVTAVTGEATYTATYTATPKAHNGANLTVAGDIQYNVYLDAEAYGVDPTEAIVKVTYNKNSNVNQNPEIVTDTITLAELSQYADAESIYNGTYKFARKVAPAQITESMTVALYENDAAATPVVELETNVYELCKGVIAGEYSAEYKDFAKSVIDYGKAAQAYFGYRNDIEDAYYHEDVMSYTKDDIVKPTAVLPAGAGITTVGFNVVSELEVNLFYNGAITEVVGDGVSAATYKTNGRNYICVSNILAQNINKEFVVSTDFGEIHLSASNVIKSILTTSSKEAYKNLARAIYGYGVYADAFYATL